MTESGRVERLERGQEKIEARVAALELNQAVYSSDKLHMDARFDKIEKLISRVSWFVLTPIGVGVLTGIVNWIIGGGLAPKL